MLRKLRQAGLTEADAHAIVVSPHNALAHHILELLRKVFDSEWSFTATELTLRELLKQNPGLFCQRTNNAWWWGETFATQKGRVHKVQLGKILDEQRGLVSEKGLAAARDVVDGIVQYYKETGIRLFPDSYVRCGDTTSYGHVFVGSFDSDGLYVGYNWG
jgi:hypothetical protein